MRLLPILLLASIASIASPGACGAATTADDLGPVDSCADLVACVARLRALAAVDENDGQLVETEDALISAFAKLDGADAAVVPLLADPSRNVAELAGAVLRSLPAIDPRFLPAIRAGMERDLGWLGPAFAVIPGDEAAAAAVHYYLAAHDSPDNQIGWAVERLGARAVPALLAAARCPQGCGVEDAYLIGDALSELDDGGAAVAPALVEIAADPRMSAATAAGALFALRQLGRAGGGVGSRLVSLRTDRPELETAIDEALLALRRPEATGAVARSLRAAPTVEALEELAAFGGDGVAAAPAVREVLAMDPAGLAPPLLDDDVADLRVAAARTLGAIGDADAVPALRSALHDRIDVRLVWAAARALGDLRATEAAADLGGVADSHWYPPARAAAAAALAVLQSPRPSQPPEDEEFDWLPYTAIDADIDACRTPRPKAMPAAAEELDAAEPAHRNRLDALAFDSVVLSYGADDEAAQRDEAAARGDDSPVIEVHPGNLREYRQPVRVVPRTALRVDGGWLAGSERGEWGGELMYLPDGDAPPVRIWDGNVEDLYRLGDRIVAVVGIAHMMTSEGRVLSLSRDGASWRADTWRVLPGAPGRSWRVDGGDLLIGTTGGTLLLSPDGSFRMAPCGDAPPASAEAGDP